MGEIQWSVDLTFSSRKTFRPKRKQERMAPKYTLNYFDTTGKAEATRMLFHAASVDFVDNRLKREDWEKQKNDVSRFPMGQMPTLQVNDEVICQSNAISRYVAREFGFYGESSCEKLLIDQVVETVDDIFQGIVKVFKGEHDEDTKKIKFGEFINGELLKKQLSFLTKLLKDNGEDLFLGSKLSLADAMFYSLHAVVVTMLNTDFLKGFPDLEGLIKNVKEVKGIKEYLATQEKK